MPLASSTYSGNTLQSSVQGDPGNAPSYLHDLAQYTRQFKPAAKQQATAGMQLEAMQPQSYAPQGGITGGGYHPQQSVRQKTYAVNALDINPYAAMKYGSPDLARGAMVGEMTMDELQAEAMKRQAWR